MFRKHDRFIHNTTSVLKSLFLMAIQVIFPSILVLIAYLVTRNVDSSLSWVPLLAGSFFILGWAAISFMISIIKEWCFLDQLNFILPVGATIIAILWATQIGVSNFLEWAALIVVTIVISFVVAKLINHFVAIRAKVRIKDRQEDYEDIEEIHHEEKKYLEEFFAIAIEEEKHSRFKKMFKRKKVSKKGFKQASDESLIS